MLITAVKINTIIAAGSVILYHITWASLLTFYIGAECHWGHYDKEENDFQCLPCLLSETLFLHKM